MLTLTSTMLTTFDDGTMTLLGRRLMLVMTGLGVSAVIVTMAIYMIARGNRALRTLKNENSKGA